MRLAAFATGDDVTEALRLFRTSTMQAASTGALSGVEGTLLTIFIIDTGEQPLWHLS